MNANPNDYPNASIYGIEWEYKYLKDEMLKRIELRQQIAAVTLTLAGIFLGVGINTESVALVYPLLAMFLAFGWAQNDYRIRESAKYIRENIENLIPGLNYETYVQQQRIKGGGLGSWRFVVLSHGGVFLGTQLMAIGIELLKFTFNLLEWGLVVVDVIAVLVVVWLMVQSAGEWRKKSRVESEHSKSAARA
jgi:hypothetical protein